MATKKPCDGKWRTPDGVMRKIRLRKLKSEQTRRSSLSALSLNTSHVNVECLNQLRITNSAKSQNPFVKKRSFTEANEVSKRRILSTSEYDGLVDTAAQPMDVLGDTDSNSSDDCGKGVLKVEPPAAQNKSGIHFIYLEEDSIQGIFTSHQNDIGIAEDKLTGSVNIPVDWTIKRKARFLSQSSFQWCSRTKGAEDARAITQAARCQQGDIMPKPSFGNPSDELQKSWRIELGRIVSFWQQPCIPWLNLFPRFGQSVKLHSGKGPVVPQTEDVMKAFYNDWVLSLRSAYQLTREKLCPFFYVCAQQYTALFRAPTIRGEEEISCILTPTTAGFRQMLKLEGIEFSLTIDKGGRNFNSEDNKENEAVTAKAVPKPDGGSINNMEGILHMKSGNRDCQDDIETDDATWDLINENIVFAGVKEMARQNMHDETSTRNTIVVRGVANTQLLFNYLVNSKNSIAKSGTQAFIPPTILSPVAFHGGSLQRLNIRSGIARSYSESTSSSYAQSDKSPKRQFSLDVSGPLLPHCIIGLTELLKKTQGFSGFKSALSTLLCTAPLNSDYVKSSGANLAISSTSKNDFGLAEKCVKTLQCSDFGSGPQCLNQVSLSNELYTWNA